MGIFAILLVALVGWLMWTGRLQRMSAKDGLMLGVALIGAIMAAKGKPVAVLPIIASAAYAAFRNRKRTQAVPPPVDDSTLKEARDLLGLSKDADEDAVRAAHRRLIATVHPDRGGTQALAAKINAARDVLLQHLAILHMHNEQNQGRDSTR